MSEIFIIAFAKEFALLAAGGIVGAMILRKRSIPCNSCRYLKRRGGESAWRYTCKSPDCRFDKHFDRPPKYCCQYKRREDE